MELYSPDQWTPTSAHLLATVADDTDLYLQKVATLRHCRDTAVSIISDAQQLSQHFRRGLCRHPRGRPVSQGGHTQCTNNTNPSGLTPA